MENIIVNFEGKQFHFKFNYATISFISMFYVEVKNDEAKDILGADHFFIIHKTDAIDPDYFFNSTKKMDDRCNLLQQAVAAEIKLKGF